MVRAARPRRPRRKIARREVLRSVPISTALVRHRLARIRDMLEDSIERDVVRGMAVCVDEEGYSKFRRGTRLVYTSPTATYRDRISKSGEECEGKEDCTFFIPCKDRGVKWAGAVYTMPGRVREEPFLLEAVASRLDFVCVAKPRGGLKTMTCYNFAWDRPELEELRDDLITAIVVCTDYGDCSYLDKLKRDLIGKGLMEATHYLIGEGLV